MRSPLSISRRNIFAAAGLLALLLFAPSLAGTAYILNSPDAFRKVSAWWMGAEYLGTKGVSMQTMANNCGPASLKMIFDHYGIPSTIVEIYKDVGLTSRGSSMLSLKNMAERKGLGVVGWRYTISDFIKAPKPAIVFVHGDHFAVADSVTPGGFVIFSDTALGKLKMSLSDFQKMWKGETLVFNKHLHKKSK